MKMMKSLLSMTAIACGAMAVVSCSKSSDSAPGNLSDYQTQVYNHAFANEFGTPAANQNWGFEPITMVNATEPMGSSEYFASEGVSAPTRAVASEVKAVTPKKYMTKEELLSQEEATCYFWLRIDNKIVLQEKQGVQINTKDAYYPRNGEQLVYGVRDQRFNTDNEGRIKIAAWQALGLTENSKGLSYASVDQPIPESIFAKVPSFETMALHVPDAKKIELAGSVEAFMTNYKIFWYVAKWQPNDTWCIHVDGVVVPKTQITVNVPEYKKRIIVEDLRGNITANSKVSGSDFDFNDVVFDAVTWNLGGKQHMKIILRAAGGRMPIYIYGKEVHEDVGYMFNTSNPNYDYAKVLIEDEIIGTGDAATFDFNSIPVEIEVDGVKTAAGSDLGKAPEKIAVDLDYKWCKERQNIKDVYPKFIDYVGDKTIDKWWK